MTQLLQLPVFVYLFSTLLISAVLFAYYRLFLRNRSFHHYNRLYLLGIPFLSLILPFIHLPIPWGNSVWHSTGSPSSLDGLRMITGAYWHEQDTLAGGTLPQPSFFTWQRLMIAAYFIISFWLLRVFIRELRYIYSLKKRYPGEKLGGICFFNTQEPGAPFSFLRSIFWDAQIDRHSARGREIFRHEHCHVRQRHTLDILWMRVLMVLCWFNPVLLLIYRELRAVHEFLADGSAISEGDAIQYAQLLVWQAAGTPTPSLPHPFFHSSIKRRITMIIQSKTRRQLYVARFMSVPLLILLCCAFAKDSHPVSSPSLQDPKKQLIVVIDAGHGGIDPGAQNAAGLQEKDIVLQIAKRIGEQAGQYPFKVIFTRTTDVLPGNAANKEEGLNQRVAIVTENKADLFISLHVNSSGGGIPPGGIDAYITPKNSGTYTKSAPLASSLLQELSNTYAVKPLLKQRKGWHIAVLDRSPCPAVLLELGYIDLPKDCQFMSSADNQEKIAHDILEGIKKYSAAQ